MRRLLWVIALAALVQSSRLHADEELAAGAEPTPLGIVITRLPSKNFYTKSIRITDPATGHSSVLEVDPSFLTIAKVPAGKYYVSEMRSWAVNVNPLKFDQPDKLFYIVGGLTNYIGDISVEKSRKPRSVSLRHDIRPKTLSEYSRRRPDLFPSGTIVISIPGLEPVVVAVPK